MIVINYLFTILADKCNGFRIFEYRISINSIDV